MDPRPPTGEPKAHPTVSRVYDDGMLVDLVYDRARATTALAVRWPDGRLSVERQVTAGDGERLRPYAAANSLIASDAVLLASAIAPAEEKAELVAAIRSFLDQHVDLSPGFADIAVHYVLLSWVYDAFSDLPYLRFRGDYGTGKTRALLTLGHLCYKAFFASGASTVSPIFHILDAFQGTLVLDEADLRFSDATADLTKVLNNGTMRGLPVLRTMVTRDKELSPRAFRVFGPKLIGMRGSFSDPALESRFLTEETGTRVMRADIPIHLPPAFKAEALALRNRLLGFRLRHFHDLAGAEVHAVPGLEARTNQTALALLSLIDDPAVRAHIAATLAQRDAAVRAERSQTIEALLVEAVVRAFEASPKPVAPVSDIAAHFNAARLAERSKPLSAKSVGHMLRSRLRLATEKTRGIYVVPARERAKAEVLAQRFAVSAVHDAMPP